MTINIEWLESTKWLESKAATIKISPDILRELVEELKELRREAGWCVVCGEEFSIHGSNMCYECKQKEEQ